jgi:hypothetical protein
MTVISPAVDLVMIDSVLLKDTTSVCASLVFERKTRKCHASNGERVSRKPRGLATTVFN